ncbi:MAG: hypothetical protein AMXMBFR4_29250 [Candidatus Hydrogenedentota bacterium]
MYARFVEWDNYIRVEFFGDNTCRVLEKVNGTATIIATGSAASTTNTWYDVRIVCDDTSVKAYHKTGTNLESQVLSATSAVTTSSKIGIVTWSNTTADLDDIWLIGDSLSNSTTFAVNNANELTTMTEPNGTTSFGFDAWGRMTSKTRGSYEATYGYLYDHLLASVESNWGGEANVSFAYGGNLLRRSRTGNGTTRKYKWDALASVLNEEDSTNALLTVFVGTTLAEAVGSDPANAHWCYHATDHLGSTHSQWSDSGGILGETLYDPHGAVVNQFGESTPRKLAGHTWDSEANFYLTLYRTYMPLAGRWMSRDSGSAFLRNLYTGFVNNPINYFDPEGRNEKYWPNGQGPKGDKKAFAVCTRNIQPGSDPVENGVTGFLNKVGGAHTYIQYGSQDSVEGWGFSGGPKGTLPSAEKYFHPDNCIQCRRTSSSLENGSGKGKKGSGASDEEILDCIKNTPASHNYSTDPRKWYVCSSWAEEVTEKCGLDCTTQYRSLKGGHRTPVSGW